MLLLLQDIADKIACPFLIDIKILVSLETEKAPDHLTMFEGFVSLNLKNFTYNTKT